MNITFIGSGYVGLVSGVMMSYLGHSVTCLDTDKDKISKLQQNILPIYEPDLDNYLPSLLKSGQLKFSSQYDERLNKSDAVFITVGTPAMSSGEADLSYVFEAIDNLSHWLRKDCLLVIKSTVPPTTCNKIIHYLQERQFQFKVASNPEFLREGSAIKDFLSPDRIIIGTNDKEAESLLRSIYLPLTRQGVPIISTNHVTAELIKYASNAFLATKIAFTNEIANLSEIVGACFQDLSLGVGLDKRIGQEFLMAGPGFGGSCFPKDILALAQLSKNHNSICTILNSVIDSNKQRSSKMVDKIIDIMGEDLNNKTIAILGLTFKAGTDDVRNSPAITILRLLLNKGANINAFDPVGINNARKDLEDKNLIYTDSAITACQDSDAVIITTEWLEFKHLDWQFIYPILKSPVVIDLRNLLDRKKMETYGFKYHSVGYKS